VPQEQLVNALFDEIDRSLDRGKVTVDEAEAREGAKWLERIEEENADELTPERIAKLEAEAARNGETDRVLLDEEASPTAGRRFTRA
jgi:(E)-4-hydroxy-3-methylbut-2-enyl-diphosphate synthase